jgi:hypothetical protein
MDIIYTAKTENELKKLIYKGEGAIALCEKL